MTLQYFILGRNPELSRQELLAYNNARNNLTKEIFFDENFLLLDVKKEIDINELGGTMKSGIIEKHGTEDDVIAYIMAGEVVNEDKFTYAVFGNADNDVFKQKFKMDKKKAMLKHGRTRLITQDNEKINLPKAS